MPTECSAERFEFGEVAGRVVVADFDGGAITSDAGALLLLGAADRAIRLTERFAACFTDRRSPDHIQHDVRTLLLQRVSGMGHLQQNQLLSRMLEPLCLKPLPMTGTLGFLPRIDTTVTQHHRRDCLALAS